MSLLIASGKHPKYIAQQARHHSAGFHLERYGHLIDTLPVTPVEWWDDLLWPAGSGPGHSQCMHKSEGTRAETRVPSASDMVGEGRFEPTALGLGSRASCLKRRQDAVSRPHF